MYIKIEAGNTTLCYTGSQYALVYREVPEINGPQADLAILEDGKVIVDYPLKPHNSVYIMNDAGKTIDSFNIP